MRRSGIALVLLGLLLGAVLSAASAFGDHQRREKIVRWDLVKIANGTGVVGGENVATDPESGESLRITGSGHVRPRRDEAFGGGTWVLEDEDGNELANGTYVVTELVSFRRLRGGNFAATGLMDGVGDPDETSSGIMVVNVSARAAGAPPDETIDAVLEVHCHLPETVEETFEGVRIRVGDRVFEPDPERHGVTLFHVMR